MVELPKLWLIGKWHKVFLTSFAEITVAEAFLGSCLPTCCCSIHLVEEPNMALAFEGLGFKSEMYYTRKCANFQEVSLKHLGKHRYVQTRGV